MIALAPLLLAASAAWAAPGLSGAQGILDVPVPETTARGKMDLSAGVRAVGTPVGLQLTGFPIGLSIGLTDRFSFAVSVTPVDDALLGSPRADATGTARLRAIDGDAGMPALAFEAEVGQLTGDACVGASAIAGVRLRRLSPTARLGPRWTREGGFGATAGVGAAVPVRSATELLLEHDLVLDERGLSDWGVRAGARGLVGPVLVAAWGGTGASMGVPWVGGGVAVALGTEDVLHADRDRDEVADGADGCRYAPEDLDDWMDTDGCPDPDNDGDGILDADDPTPDGEPDPDRKAPQFRRATPYFPLTIPEKEMPPPDAQSSRLRTPVPAQGVADEPAKGDEEAP